MRTSLIALLVAILCIGTVCSLLCYSCENESSQWNCVKTAQCAETDMYCFSRRSAIRKGQNSGHKFSKGCSTNCTARSVNTGRVFKATTCCTFDHCNSGRQLQGKK